MFGKKKTYGGGVEYLIVGLGNPDKKYEKTRHNAGWLAIDSIADKFNCRVDRVKFKSYVGECEISGRKVMLMKPTTYMNNSGQAVVEAMNFYKIEPENVIVLFDDISLAPGRLRIRAEGSAGGHNGIKSIIQELGSQDFPRVKIGVGAKPHAEQDLADWVLSTFSASEEKDLSFALPHAGNAALCIIQNGVPEAANRFNGIRP